MSCIPTFSQTVEVTMTNNDEDVLERFLKIYGEKLEVVNGDKPTLHNLVCKHKDKSKYSGHFSIS